MRWSYKTIHYELKKEGILGSAFLDESEIELSLNQYGKAGWELVSLLETLDGLVAVFKQPLGIENRRFAAPLGPAEKGDRPPREAKRNTTDAVQPPIRQKQTVAEEIEEVAEAVLLDYFEVVEEKTKEEVKKKPSGPPADVGMIRIE